MTHLPPLSSDALEKLTEQIADDVVYGIYLHCIKQLPKGEADKLICLVRMFPSNTKHHTWHSLGVHLVCAFYRQYIYNLCMKPSKEVVEHARQYVLRLMQERFQTSCLVDHILTPSMMDYMEGYLDPELFQHNLPVLFGEEGGPVKRVLQAIMQKIVVKTDSRRVSEMTRVQSILRSLNQAQLELVAKTNQSVQMQCQALSPAMVPNLIRSNAFSSVLALQVHGQLYLECASVHKADKTKTPADIFQEIAVLLHDEHHLRTMLLPLVHTLQQKYKLSLDNAFWRF